MPLFDRYRSGSYVAAYDELVTARAKDDVALAVAMEIMSRARANIEKLVERWRGFGFSLTAPLGEAGQTHVALVELEEKCGTIAPTLHAFYEQIGWVDFVEEPPGEPWPDVEQMDSLAFDDLSSQLDELIEGSSHELILFGDPLIKFNISGVGGIYVPLPMSGFDADLHFEGDAIQWPDGHALRLVPYLRESILARGGIGMLGAPQEELDPTLIRDLTDGLVPF
jgi:hypothetical protein